MVFSSYEFIFVFLPVTLIGYYALSRLQNPLFQRLYLIAASFIFYGYFNARYLLLILSSIFVNYLLARGVGIAQEKSKRLARAMFILGVAFNVGLLGYFKYYDFFIENINRAFHTSFVLKRLLLPLGISFFTFQQLSFLVSVYKKEEQVAGFLDYTLFVSFFPQLIAGPIVLYAEMRPQFADEKRRAFDAAYFARGAYLFAIGLFKKAMIADSLAVFADNGFAQSGALTFAAAWATSLSYTLQIYFDFSGYSDMAVGLAGMFHFDIPFNFRSPYQAVGIADFWRRWHITLGRALRAYIYYPLGGSRKGKARTYLNLFLTFLISGLWHGAAWTFVLWGVLHGTFMILERALEQPLTQIPRAVRILATFLIVNALWVLFRAESFTQAAEVLRGMTRVSDIGVLALAGIAFDATVNFPAAVDILYVTSALVVLLCVVRFAKCSETMAKAFRPRWSAAALCATLFCVSVICLSRRSVFIYFNF